MGFLHKVFIWYGLGPSGMSFGIPATCLVVFCCYTMFPICCSWGGGGGLLVSGGVGVPFFGF